jgi:hypothetical protein
MGDAIVTGEELDRLDADVLLTLAATTTLYVVSAELARRVFYRQRVRASTDPHRLEPAQHAG